MAEELPNQNLSDELQQLKLQTFHKQHNEQQFDKERIVKQANESWDYQHKKPYFIDEEGYKDHIIVQYMDWDFKPQSVKFHQKRNAPNAWILLQNKELEKINKRNNLNKQTQKKNNIQEIEIKQLNQNQINLQRFNRRIQGRNIGKVILKKKQQQRKYISSKKCCYTNPRKS
ncbi:unnamed protein product [Paramecium sonneborni]|uniref:Uncharacterized protein n=1 Tax=Paramecium sonneborni TaxID=65129 RepID=A0A8S1NAI3_9CILI|nr:unnamed protein product [Paramecium sonneborni]